jgi:hypothetical protein
LGEHLSFTAATELEFFAVFAIPDAPAATEKSLKQRRRARQ